MNRAPGEPVAPSEFPDVEPRSFSDFRDSGLLWLVNATVFHPRGYALALSLDVSGEVSGWNLMGDGTGPWGFACDDETQEHIDELFARVRELMP